MRECKDGGRGATFARVTSAPHILPLFVDIAKALLADRRWFDDRTVLRYSAMALMFAPEPSVALTQRVRAAADAVVADASWFSGLRTSLRLVLAAQAIAAGIEPRTFVTESHELRERFRKAGLRRAVDHGWIAAAMLRLAGATSAQDVARLAEIYAAMKTHHWWLTGPEDLPACALLVVHGGDLGYLAPRIETIYAGLRQAGMPARDGVQTASHVLALARGSESEVVTRFVALDRGFTADGVAMWDCDRDELAMLCLLDEPPATTIERVREHRAHLRRELGAIGPVTSFSLACGTAFLTGMAGRPRDRHYEGDRDAANLLLAANAAAHLTQQRAAAAAAAS